jgi:predicted GIY-YIG superfamily endonuclease
MHLVFWSAENWRRAPIDLSRILDGFTELADSTGASFPIARRILSVRLPCFLRRCDRCRGGSSSSCRLRVRTETARRAAWDSALSSFAAPTSPSTKATPLWAQEFSSREEALEREQQVKRWSRAKKLALARSVVYRVLFSSKYGTTCSARSVAQSTNDPRSPCRVSLMHTPARVGLEHTSSGAE